VVEVWGSRGARLLRRPDFAAAGRLGRLLGAGCSGGSLWSAPAAASGRHDRGV